MIPPFRQAKMCVPSLIKQILGICAISPLRCRKHRRSSEAPPAKAAEAARPSRPRQPHPRRALNSIFEVNARLRIASSRTRLAAGSGAAFLFASCAGGVGKTTLCATAARVLSSRVSNVLVADRCSDGIIPYYFSLERQCGRLTDGLSQRSPDRLSDNTGGCPWNEQPNTPTAAWLEQLQAESVLT